MPAAAAAAGSTPVPSPIPPPPPPRPPPPLLVVAVAVAAPPKMGRHSPVTVTCAQQVGFFCFFVFLNYVVARRCVVCD